MSIATKQEQKEEALKRLRMMDYFKPSVDAFAEDGVVMMNEPPDGTHYELNEKQKEFVDKFEKEYGALVYAAIRSYTEFGTLNAYIYVTKHKSEWKDDENDIKENWCFAYVENEEEPLFSEIGGIGFEKTEAGGLRRTA